MTPARLGVVLAALAGLCAPLPARAQTPTFPPYVGPAGSQLAAQGVGLVSATSSDGSGTIVAGGTPQPLFGGLAPVNGFKVAIPSSTPAAFICWLSDTTPTPSAAAPGSYPIQAAGQYSTEIGEKPAGPVYLTCPTTGQAFSAKKW